MATVVEDWQTTAACANESPGIAATSIGQYVTRFTTASRSSTVTWASVIEPITVQTVSRSAILGRIPRNTTATTAGNSRIRATRTTRLATETGGADSLTNRA
jgi:hypothetical protein